MSTLDRTPAAESTAPPGALGVVMFVVCFAMFVGGLVLMGIGFDQASWALFSVGMLASGLAFVIPIQLLPGMD